MAIDKRKYAQFLDTLAEDLDIPPSKFREAVEHYQAVGDWLEKGAYPQDVRVVLIYPQGSFRIGTVVRPIREGVEAGYDIDLVCELHIPMHFTDARSLKMMVGDRIKEHEKYRQMLVREGKRCWTLEYAEQDGIGFHLDVLPALPDHQHLPSDTSIAITNKQGTSYSWSSSNPTGYAEWFESKNQPAFRLVSAQHKRRIQLREPTIYASVDDVPDQLVRTPLQKLIQIMKRHRDLHFCRGVNSDHAPISIIISTLAAHLYNREPDVLSALTSVVKKLYAYVGLVENNPAKWAQVSSDLISRTSDGKWYIGNPVNTEENFADRWHEDGHARANAFFSWVALLKRDLIDFLDSPSTKTVRDHLSKIFGAATVAPFLELIATTPAVETTPPRIQISNPSKPWGMDIDPCKESFT